MPADLLTILHVDLDAFYASVEQRDHPELRGLPVIVGWTQGRGVVCAASYEARPFGVHSAMPMAAARRLCPHAVFLPPRMSHYAGIARQVRDVFLSFTALVEPLSLDEAFLDVRGSLAHFGPAATLAAKLKQAVRDATGLTASVGVAVNKFLAKLASDLGKPDGLVVVPPDAAGFLAPLPVGRLWGVGARGEKRLHALGVRTIGQLAALAELTLVGHFGEAGRQLWRLAHGLDDRAVVPDREAKSLGSETTFATDVDDPEALRARLLELVEGLAARLRQHQLRARTVEVKVRSADFRTRTRAQTLGDATDLTDVLWGAARLLLERSLTRDMLPVRLLGVAASNLTREALVQGDLFEQDHLRRRAALDRAVDAIRGRLGSDAIKRGSLLGGDGL